MRMVHGDLVYRKATTLVPPRGTKQGGTCDNLDTFNGEEPFSLISTYNIYSDASFKRL